MPTDVPALAWALRELGQRVDIIPKDDAVAGLPGWGCAHIRPGKPCLTRG